MRASSRRTSGTVSVTSTPMAVTTTAPFAIAIDGGGLVRTTAKNACASNAKVLCRSQAVQRRTW
jgi:hypothetical protein